MQPIVFVEANANISSTEISTMDTVQEGNSLTIRPLNH